MIDEKKLIEELKESGFIIDDDFGNELVDFIDAQPKAGEWIPVSERLPEEDGHYLITISDFGVVSSFYNKHHKLPWWGIRNSMRYRMDAAAGAVGG